MRTALIALFIYVFVVPSDSAGGQAQSVTGDSAHAYIYPDAYFHDFRSGINNRPYRLWVALPQTYASRPASRYPVLYLLDGGISLDRKSTRLNSSHSQISYAVF